MAIDFPASPTLNDEYSFEGRTWRWNATGWEVKEYPAALLAGTAANPSLYFSGDPNTGIYSPGADQVAIATNGVGRLFIDSNGAIRILNQGTTSSLEVGNGTNTDQTAFIDLIADTTYTDYGLRLIRDAGANGSGQLIHRGTTELSIRTQDAAPLTFFTNITERLRITPTGNVGIGTSAPWSASVVFGLGTVGDVTSSRQFSVGASSTYNVSLGYYQTGAAQPFAGVVQALDNGNGTRLLLNPSGGNVGIGTSAPGYKLHVDGSCAIAGDKNLRLGEGSFTYYYDLGRDVATGAFIFNGNQSGSVAYVFQAAGTERARIDSSGRLLVGTSSAYAVEGFNRHHYFNPSAGDSNNHVVIGASGTSGFPAVYFTRTRASAANVATTAVQDNDLLGFIGFYGANGTDFSNNAASITARVDGEPFTSGDTTDLPGRLVFSVTADGSASATEALRISSNRAITVSDGGNLVLGTTTGTKIGTATTQKLGFYNATPVVQPAAVADATDAATVITQLNDLLAKLRTLGIIAT